MQLAQEIESMEKNTARENRQKALQATKDAMTTAKKIHHSFVAGKPPQTELRSANDAVRAAQVLHRGLQAAMSERGLDPNDVRVAIAFCDTGLTLAVMQKFIPGQEKFVTESLADQPAIMLGLIFGIVDREEDPNGDVLWAGMKPFIFSRQVVDWLDGLIRQLTNGGN